MEAPLNSSNPPTSAARRHAWSSIGPAVIVAAVVCGPGSILVSSRVGAQFGYSMIWVLALACFLMVAMVTLAMRIGISFRETPCGEIARRWGRPTAILLGCVLFLIIAAFQSSNNIAVAASLEAFGWETSNWLEAGGLVAINLALIGFLYGGREQYRRIEQAMKWLVLLMVVAFLLNAVYARPSLAGMLGGLWPTLPNTGRWELMALVGTTFSIAGAFYQAYLVRERHWGEHDWQRGRLDAIVGIAALGGITLLIMVTSAATFHSLDPIPQLDTAVDVARQLDPLFGSTARFVFGIGILAGALSSFLVNALIGGHILADSLGWGDRVASPWTRHFTTLALLIGMGVALASLATGMSRVRLIVVAQALTVVGGPALALALLTLGWQKRKQDPTAIPAWILWAASAGLLVTALLSWRTLQVIFGWGTGA